MISYFKISVLGVAAAFWVSNALAKDWKTVVIAMEGAYEPWNLTDSSGNIVGFEVDLANDVCTRAGVECKIVAQDWDGMMPGLQAGKFDVIMDGLSITEARMKQIMFSRPYATTPAVFMARKDSPLAKGHSEQ
jgi:octopine/nopaline transport system substrate-binding protein